MATINKLVNQFRNAIDKAVDNNEFQDDTFSEFPKGCCGDTSDLLAHYLLVNGYKSYYMNGTYYGCNNEIMQSHAWLMLDDGTIIDITGDQFMYRHDLFNKMRVYIGDRNSFYDHFEMHTKEKVYHTGINGLDEYSRTRMFMLYDKIMKYID